LRLNDFNKEEIDFKVRRKEGGLMKQMIVIAFVLSMLFTGLECKKEPPTNSPPLTSCDSPPGNRSFTWRTDTVGWFPTTLGGVWAFSDTDAYVMGYLGEGKAPYRIFDGLHWNGKVWSNDIHESFLGDIGHTPLDVTGDDHFMVSVGYWGMGSSTGVQYYAGLAEFDNSSRKWTPYEFQTQGKLYSVWTDGKGYFIAVGDNGMVYTKDGYSATWNYSKAPTNFSLTHIVGISKTEMYASAFLSLATGQEYDQYWKFDGTQWSKLFDNQDTTGNVVTLPGDYSEMTDVAVYRCPVTDSLQLYLSGWDSFLLIAKGQSLRYSATNLSSLGLPLHSMRNTAGLVNLFTPNDIWFLSSEYNFYQWNGKDFQQMYIPGLPAPETYTGFVRNIVKTKSGKVFFPCEVSPQVYVVAQGTP
jgi:hypothetical protein